MNKKLVIITIANENKNKLKRKGYEESKQQHLGIYQMNISQILIVQFHKLLTHQQWSSKQYDY